MNPNEVMTFTNNQAPPPAKRKRKWLIPVIIIIVILAMVMCDAIIESAEWGGDISLYFRWKFIYYKAYFGAWIEDIIAFFKAIFG